MKTHLPLLLTLALTIGGLRAEPSVPAETTSTLEASSVQPATKAAWSVVGTWDGMHPHWQGPLTFKADGTLLGNWGEDMGQWLLHEQDGHLLIVLCGRDWPCETACLVTADDLLGVVKGGLLRLHRRPASPPAARPPGFPVPAPTDFALTGPLWSLLGTWDATHGGDWSAPLTFLPDGTFLKDGNAAEGGRWVLSPDRSGALLVLCWQGWPAEATVLCGAEEFRGDSVHSVLRMHRRAPAPVIP